MAKSNAVQLAQHVGAAITADGSSGIITAYSFVGSGANLTGIDATSIKDSGGTVRAQGNTSGIEVTGIITATTVSATTGSFTSVTGDGSGLTGLPAGLGTAISASGDGAYFYYTDQTLEVGSNLTLDTPATTPIYTQYADIAVSNGVDLIVAEGDELVTDILGIGTAGSTELAGSGGRIRADEFTTRDTKGAPTFATGINITGVGTFSSSVIVGSAVTANADGVVVGGAVTATSLVYGSTDVSTELATKATTGKAIAMAMVFG